MTSRSRSEGGFGLIEMLIALMVLNIAILALIASFSSGMLALNRASRTATAATLADVEMERMRAIRYCDIRLSSTASDATYATLLSGTLITDATASTCAAAPAAAAGVDRTRSVTGADGRAYRVDTYIVCERPTSPPTACTPDDANDPNVRDALKTVTFVVRDPADANKVVTRQSSTFHRTTG